MPVARALTGNGDVDPVTNEEFAARLDALSVGDRFAVAVSGGRDSMALARLAALYAQKTGRQALAFTVDHRLRTGAADEADQTGAWCKAVGLVHKTLVWEGEKPETGIQERARKARYRLLATACVDAGASAVLTGHSSDDQAETVFMRLARGAGPSGLAGMNHKIVIAAGASAPIQLLRPLLGFSRAQLTASVAAFDQPYIDDPSNDDIAFERIRVRRKLAALEGAGAIDKAALIELSAQMRSVSDRQRLQEQALFQKTNGCFYRWGGACVDLAAFPGGDDDTATGLARRLIHAVSGSAYAPDYDASAGSLAAALRSGAATIGGALIKAAKGRLWFLREPAAVLGRAGVSASEPVSTASTGPILWDNRFIIHGAPSGESVVLRPLGPHGVDRLGPQSALCEGPQEALFTAPAIFRGETLIGALAALSGGATGFSARSLAKERFRGGIIRYS